MASIRTDYSQWPIVILTSEGAMGDEETQMFLGQLSTILARQERYITIFDSSSLSNYKMGDRDRIVAWLKSNDSQLRRYSIGTGVVLSSGALRFAIAAVMLVYRPASPIKVFATLNSALAWARAQVQNDAGRAIAAAQTSS